MTKKEAAIIIEAIQVDNLRGWLEQAKRNGRVYYHVHSVNRNGDFRRITLATIGEQNGRPYLDFFWPSCVPQYTSDDPGASARVLLGHSGALDVAAKLVGFNFKRRSFAIGGGGMDMVYALLDNLGTIAGVDINDIERVNMDRS